MNELDKLIENLENGVNEAEEFDLANAEKNLTKILAKITKIKGFKISLKSNGKRITGESPDYAKLSPFGGLFKKLIVRVDLGSIRDGLASIMVSYDYIHPDGGHNGYRLARIEFDLDGNITIIYDDRGNKIKV